MRTTFVGLSLIAIVAAAAPAFAEDAPSPITLTAGATLISDYRFRGISQNDRSVAPQGTLIHGIPARLPVMV